MAKRMVTSFSRAGFRSYGELDDDAHVRPCVYGVPWVQPDTLETIRRHDGKRTGPKREPLDADASAGH
jgi:hypothetical protein